MRALMSVEKGGPDSLILQDIDEPVAGSGEVVIDVKACAVNFPDILIIQDLYQFKPERPFAPGGEIAGIVAQVGENVENVEVGDRVLGMSGWNGMMEKVKLTGAACRKIPDEMSFVEASAFAMTYGTSYHALKDRGRIQNGESVVILGAAGGVGVAAIELAKSFGANVIAGVSSKEKAEFCTHKGADQVIIYPTGDLTSDQQKSFSGMIKEKTAGFGADIIYDAIGGSYAEPALRAMNWRGRYLVVGFPAGIPALPTNLALLKGCEIVGVFWGAYTGRESDQFTQDMNELFALYSEKKIKPHISETFPLEKGGEAIQMLAERKVLGKVVVTI